MVLVDEPWSAHAPFFAGLGRKPQVLPGRQFPSFSEGDTGVIQRIGAEVPAHKGFWRILWFEDKRSTAKIAHTADVSQLILVIIHSVYVLLKHLLFYVRCSAMFCLYD